MHTASQPAQRQANDDASDAEPGRAVHNAAPRDQTASSEAALASISNGAGANCCPCWSSHGGRADDGALIELSAADRCSALHAHCCPSAVCLSARVCCPSDF